MLFIRFLWKKLKEHNCICEKIYEKRTIIFTIVSFRYKTNKFIQTYCS